MKLAIVLGTLIVPVAFLIMRRLSVWLRTAIDAVAAVSAFGFGILSAFAVADIRAHGAVFSTEVHKVFDSFWFLAFGGYLGVYALSRLLWSAFAAWRGAE